MTIKSASISLLGKMPSFSGAAVFSLTLFSIKKVLISLLGLGLGNVTFSNGFLSPLYWDIWCSLYGLQCLHLHSQERNYDNIFIR